MSTLVELKQGDSIIFDRDRAAWFVDDGEPLTETRNARATLDAPVNFYAEEGVRSRSALFTVTETYQSTDA